jgi:uncharacterized membrane protein
LKNFIKPINSPVLAYCLNLGYSLIIVVGTFLLRDTLELLGEDWSEYLVIFFFVGGTMMLTVHSASIKCVVTSIMGFQSGILIPVLLISWRSGYEIDWVKVWIILIIASTGTFISALLYRFLKQRKTRRIEKATHE